MGVHATQLKSGSKTGNGAGKPARQSKAVANILRAGVQPKLKIGAANDPAEIEADRVADQVMRMPASSSTVQPTPPPANSKVLGSDIIRRKSPKPKTPKQLALDLVSNFIANKSSIQAFTNISKSKLVSDLKTRINNIGGVDQESLNACGSAATAYIIGQDNIVQFTQFVLDLYQFGKAKLGTKEIDPWDGLLSRAPGDSNWGKGKYINNVVDFIVLASLTSSESNWFDQFEDPGDDYAGITFPSTIESWLKASGNYTNVTDDTDFFGPGFEHFKNTLIKKHNSGHKVVMLIGSTMISISRGSKISKKQSKTNQLKSGKLGNKAQTSLPNHYVIYKGEFKESGKKISFKIWTWGSSETIEISKTDFKRLYYGGIYAK